jgi:acetyl esterase/lipase
MSNQLTRRDFAIRTAGFGLATGLAPAATLAETEQASRSEPSLAIADPYSLVDPELLPALKAFPAFNFSAEMVGKFRQTPATLPQPPPAPQPVERHIPGLPGAPEVRLWVVDPAPSEKGKPVLLHMHGGGFMVPDPVLMPRLQGIATDCNCVAISVDYRLAPETHYPGSLEDNYAALKWIHAHAAELGIDSSRIAVGGESAGGGHAATLAIHALTATNFPSSSSCSSTPSWTTERVAHVQRRPPLATLMWTASANRFAWSSLLGVPAGSSKVPAAAVPGRIASVDGLPPAWIGVGSIDLFVEEDTRWKCRGRVRAQSLCSTGADDSRAGNRKYFALPSAAQSRRHRGRADRGGVLVCVVLPLSPVLFRDLYRKGFVCVVTANACGFACSPKPFCGDLRR